MLMSNNEHTTEFQNNTFGQLPKNRLSVYTPEYAKDMRIDKFLSLNYTFFSRAKIQELIKKGKVKVNHKTNKVQKTFQKNNLGLNKSFFLEVEGKI